jgi:hypothetical protein
MQGGHGQGEGLLHARNQNWHGDKGRKEIGEEMAAEEEVIGSRSDPLFKMEAARCA